MCPIRVPWPPATPMTEAQEMWVGGGKRQGADRQTFQLAENCGRWQGVKVAGTGGTLSRISGSWLVVSYSFAACGQ